MNYQVLSESFVRVLGDLPPEIRDMYLHKFIADYRRSCGARTERTDCPERIRKVCELRQSGKSIRYIAKELRMSKRDVGVIVTNYR
jgi:DNA-binding NarL/FixJ family response regulator